MIFARLKHTHQQSFSCCWAERHMFVVGWEHPVSAIDGKRICCRLNRWYLIQSNAFSSLHSHYIQFKAMLRQGNAKARQCDWVSYVSIFNVLWCWVEYIHFTQLTHISKFNTTFNIKQLCSVQNCSVFIIITCIVGCFIIIIIFDFDFLILILIILRVVVMWCAIVHCYVIVMRTNDCQFIQLQLTC